MAQEDNHMELIDDEAVLLTTEEDWTTWGVKKGPRLKVLKLIQEKRRQSNSIYGAALIRRLLTTIVQRRPMTAAASIHAMTSEVTALPPETKWTESA